MELMPCQNKTRFLGPETHRQFYSYVKEKLPVFLDAEHFAIGKRELDLKINRHRLCPSTEMKQVEHIKM